MAVSSRTLSAKGARRHHRFKESIRGSIENLGASYHFLVEDISDRGFHLLSCVAVEIGDRMNVYLRLSQSARLACIVEARHVTSDGLGCEIVGIGEAASCALSQRIQEHYSAQFA
jgi:hypothetical protein